VKEAAHSPEEITRASKSNLALAFVALPPERRRDISVFYAFCRVIDDIADDPGETIAPREAALNSWRQALDARFEGEPPLAAAVRD
jgi:phytoene synthase